MDRKSFVMLAVDLTSILSFSAMAEVYKCADGKYQADPCNKSSNPIDLSNVGSVITCRRYANNNLAGATWLQSLAQEMATVVQQAILRSHLSVGRLNCYGLL